MEKELDSLFNLEKYESLNLGTSAFVMRAELVYHRHGCALVKCDHIQEEIWGDRWVCPVCHCYRMVGSPEIVREY